jgi:nucleoid DNA-binding protein
MPNLFQKFLLFYTFFTTNRGFFVNKMLKKLKILAFRKIMYIIEHVHKKRSFKMNKEELVQEISKKASVTQKEASEVLSALIETIQKTVSKGKKVTLVGFGTFESRKRAARTGRNPQTGKELKIPARTVPAFSAGKKFKTIVNGK